MDRDIVYPFRESLKRHVKVRARSNESYRIQERSILFITPHQLSSDALQLQRENTEDFVKVIANRGYYDGCRRLGQEPDLEIHHHLVKYQGKTYLAMQRGKHRNTVTSEELQYLLLPLSPVGTIPWDIDKEESIGLRVMPGSVIGGEMDMDAWSI